MENKFTSFLKSQCFPILIELYLNTLRVKSSSSGFKMMVVTQIITPYSSSKKEEGNMA